jgi:hypothetical protein
MNSVKHLSFSISYVICLALALYSGTSTAQLADLVTVDTYFRKSGFDRQLKEMEKTMPAEHAAGLNQVPNLSVESKARADAAVRKVFTAEKMKAVIQSEILKTVSNDDLKETTTFYDLKVASEIVSADLEYAMRDAIQRQARMETLMANFAKGEPKRWSTYKRIETAAGLSDFMFTVMRSMTLATMRSIGAVVGRDTSNEREAIDEDFRKNASKLKENFRLPMTLTLLDAYENVSDEAISKYAESMESPAGRRVNSAALRAFQKMFDTLGNEIGVALGEKSVSAACATLRCEREPA